MRSEESLRAGEVDGALRALQDQVRGDPSNAKLRIFLFQLLAVNGEWDRALNQLNVCGDLDPGALAMVQTYREALRCEVFRREVFAGERSPLIFGKPEPWIAFLIEALRAEADGQDSHAAALRARAFEEADETTGTLLLEGESAAPIPFAWIADADTRLGPVTEAIVNGRYYWIPFQNIAKIHLEKPSDLRDFVWAPVHFTWANGGETVGLIPTRYPGSESNEDAQIKLARKTAWERAGRNKVASNGEDLYHGVGQRLLATDRDEYALLDLRQITLATAKGDGHGGD